MVFLIPHRHQSGFITSAVKNTATCFKHVPSGRTVVYQSLGFGNRENSAGRHGDFAVVVREIGYQLAAFAYKGQKLGLAGKHHHLQHHRRLTTSATTMCFKHVFLGGVWVPVHLQNWRRHEIFMLRSAL